MYLALRVTGNIIWPILLHATTDPSIFLLTAYPGASPLTPIADFGNILVIITGLALRRLHPRSCEPEVHRHGSDSSRLMISAPECHRARDRW